MQQRQIESQSRQEALHTILISLRLSGELNFRFKFLKIFLFLGLFKDVPHLPIYPIVIRILVLKIIMLSQFI